MSRESWIVSRRPQSSSGVLWVHSTARQQRASRWLLRGLYMIGNSQGTVSSPTFSSCIAETFDSSLGSNSSLLLCLEGVSKIHRWNDLMYICLSIRISERFGHMWCTTDVLTDVKQYCSVLSLVYDVVLEHFVIQSPRFPSTDCILNLV